MAGCQQSKEVASSGYSQMDDMLRKYFVYFYHTIWQIILLDCQVHAMECWLAFWLWNDYPRGANAWSGWNGNVAAAPAAAGGNTVVLGAGNSIPTNGSCTIAVNVTSVTAGPAVTKPNFLDIITVNIRPAGSFPTTINGSTITIDFGIVNPTDFYTVTVTTRVNALGQPPGGTNNVVLSTNAAGDQAFNNFANANLVIPNLNTGQRVTPKALPQTGFAPGVVTHLPAQPQHLAYIPYNISIEIPALNVKASIAGVPFEDGWCDVTWLGKGVGWLHGTAFPSWTDNSVLTGHVYTADGLPGPFINLNRLKWGDQIIIHAFGQKYVYEVRMCAMSPQPIKRCWPTRIIPG
mgnify:CR=1 FL=1